jgi:hypothetical protein
VAALAVLAALFTARGAAASERLPALGRVMEALPFATCALAPDAPGESSRRRSTDGSSILDVDSPPPALALPRVRSGSEAKPGARDAVAGVDGMVFVPGVAAGRFDPGAAARAAQLREHASPASGVRTSHLARGPPVTTAVPS